MTEETRNPRGAGRKSHAPTPELRQVVYNMSAIGWPQLQIAEILGISDNTLRKHYTFELSAATGLVCAKAMGTLLDAMEKDRCIKSAMFILSTRGGLKKTEVNELTGKDGAALQPPAPPVFNVIFADPNEEGQEGSGG